MVIGSKSSRTRPSRTVATGELKREDHGGIVQDEGPKFACMNGLLSFALFSIRLTT